MSLVTFSGGVNAFVTHDESSVYFGEMLKFSPVKLENLREPCGLNSLLLELLPLTIWVAE